MNLAICFCYGYCLTGDFIGSPVVVWIILVLHSNFILIHSVVL